MTAFEFAKKIELLNRILGPVYGRLQSEFMNPLIDREFNLMYHQGALPPPPDRLLEEGGDIDVVFDNPLVRAQRAEDADAMAKVMMDIGPVAAVKPEILDNFDFDAATRRIAEVRGVPAIMIRSVDEVAVLREARAGAAEKEREREDMMATTQAVRNVAPMVRAVKPKEAS